MIPWVQKLQPPHLPEYKMSPWLGSIANIVQQPKYYYHAKFGAFTPECTIFSLYGLTIRLGLGYHQLLK